MTYKTRKGTASDRFDRFVNRAGPTPEHAPHLGRCHPWTGSLHTDGYGKFWLHGKSVRAPRFAVQRDGREIPRGYEPDHLCRVRSCVNPSHLEVVTKQENLRRAGEVRRGRAIGNAAIQSAKTHCKRGHDFNPINTRIYRGKRNCRTCARTYLSRRNGATS